MQLCTAGRTNWLRRRARRGTRAMGVALVIAVLATACGGSSDPSTTGTAVAADDAAQPSTDTDAASGSDPTVLAGAADAAAETEFVVGEMSYDKTHETSKAVAEYLVNAHGDPGGFVALVEALERGYDADQIIDGVLKGNVDANGNVEIAGSPVAPLQRRLNIVMLEDHDIPEGEALGFSAPAEDKIPVLHLLRAKQVPLTGLGLFGQLQRKVNQEDTVDSTVQAAGWLIAVIVDLARVGYSLGQIQSAIVFGDGRFREVSKPVGLNPNDPIRTCPVLEFGGRTILPEGDPPVDDDASRFCGEAFRFLRERRPESLPDVGIPAAEIAGTYLGFVRFGSQLEDNDRCTVMSAITVEIGIGGSVFGTAEGGPVFLREQGGCRRSSSNIVFRGTWDGDGAIFAGLGDAEITGWADGAGLSLQLASGGGESLRITSFFGCASKDVEGGRCAGLRTDHELYEASVSDG